MLVGWGGWLSESDCVCQRGGSLVHVQKKMAMIAMELLPRVTLPETTAMTRRNEETLNLQKESGSVMKRHLSIPPFVAFMAPIMS